MIYSYRRWVDLGPKGTPASEITLDYQTERDYIFSGRTNEAVTETWTALKAMDEGLFDAPSFNLCGVTDARLDLGPTRFRDHRVRRALLAGDDRVPQTYSRSVTKELRENVHLLSSFVAVIADGQLCLGIKLGGPEDAPFLSLPGSGYLDREADMEDDTVANAEQIIGRELREELSLAINDVSSVRCLGVFEDTHPNSHLNPALFSVIETELSPDVVRECARTAPDRDEFTDLAFPSVAGDMLSALVARSIPGKSQGHLPASLPFNNVGQLSHKTLLMLLLLGRYTEGVAWFADHWTRFNACKFEDPSA